MRDKSYLPQACFIHSLDRPELSLIFEIVLTTERNDGGHYAALEDPEGIMEDVREIAAQEWKKSS